MRILIPSGIFHPESGGPATYLYHFLPELQARGHEVEVITFSDDQPTESYPYPVLRIPRSHLLHRNWVHYRAVKRRLPQSDLLYINSLGLSLPRLSKPSVLKIVGDRAWERCINRGWIPANEDIDHFQQHRYHPGIEWVKRARAKEARAVNRVIVPSQYLQKMVMAWGVPAEKISVVYNAFEPPPRPPQTLSRADLNLPDNPLLLMVGRLTAWKGLDHLLQALAHLPDVHLVVIGAGSSTYQELVQALKLEKRVHFLGQIPHERLLSYYQVADYTVLYSGYEGLSHVILESLSLGTPVIASDKGGNPEIVEDGLNGFLAPYPDGLLPTLQKALNSRRLQAVLDTERFRWSSLVEQTLQILEQTAECRA